MDFCDKLVISITLIIVTVFCVFNNFVLATENIVEIPEGYYKLDQELKFSNFSFTLQGSLMAINYSNVYEVKLKKGANYILIPNSYACFVTFTNEELTLDATGLTVSRLSPGQYYFYNDNTFDFLYISYYTDNTVDVYTNASGMSDAITNLSSIISSNDLWSTFEKSIPYIAVVVLSSFGFYLIIHNIIELSKGRDD